ncbi:sensor histidine kinase [Nonomuraea sp. NPDC050790]|uniref:sensor histidine kinase n=1 Tax=Nonomuraea sp. NPDC050790 TaxID=3364371 RepID=UPI0037ABE836
MRAFAGALALLAVGTLVTGTLLEGTGPGQWIFVALGLLTPVLGWLIAVRRPEIPYGWLLLATACSLGVGTLGVGLSVGTGADVLGAALSSVFAVFYGLVWVFLPLLFPDGRLPSRRWRPVAWIAAVAIAVHLVALPLADLEIDGRADPIALPGNAALLAAVVGGLAQTVVFLMAIVVLVGLVFRVRRARAQERPQYLWMLGGSALGIAGFLMVTFYFYGQMAVAAFGAMTVLASVPAAIGVALVRHRLLDIRLGIRGSRLSLVFDMRPTVSELLSELSPELQDAEPGEQLAGLARAVQEGLNVRWAEVSLTGGARFTAGVRQGEAAVREPVAGGLGELAVGQKSQGRFTAEDRRLLHAFAVPVGLAIRSAALAGRLVNAQEAERRRLERNIHDGVQQQLVALIAGLELARASNAGAEMLPPLREQARQTLDDLRELAAGIHPSVLAQGGLVEAVESRCVRLPVPTTVLADPGLRAARFPDEIEGALYFTVSEALANALKHAAAAKIEVRLSRQDGRLRATVRDDGRGFEPSATALGALADRLSALGGGLKVTSTIGEGTTVSAWVPEHG